MTADYKTYRLYLEMMTEAVSLGDRPLIEMVLLRIGNIAQSPANATGSNIISFPIGQLAPVPAAKEKQNLWTTALRIAIIPLGMILFVAAFHYFSLFVTVTCQS